MYNHKNDKENTMKKIVFVIGSLRKDSFNRKVADNAKAMAPADWHIEEAVIGDLPLYNQDQDGEVITSYERVRQQVNQADGVIFFTPEYNRGLPAGLKNLIDVVSRPSDTKSWAGKKVAIASATPGRGNANLAATELQRIAYYQQMIVSTTMINFSQISKALDDNGQLTDEFYRKALQQFIEHFDALL